MLLSLVEAAHVLAEIALEVKPSGTALLGTGEGGPRLLVDQGVSVELRPAPELLVAGGAPDRLHGLEVGVLGGPVLLEV